MAATKMRTIQTFYYLVTEESEETWLPLLQRQYSEITDFYLPPEGCSYRVAGVQIKKSYPGHARRVMFGIWSFLRQFMYYPS